MPPKEKRKYSPLFYVCYAELCKKQNFTPLSIFKQLSTNQNKAVLDIPVDRIKFDEWSPILTALSNDNSLHFIALRCRLHAKKIAENVDTEVKLRQAISANTLKISILSKFALGSLLDSIVTLLSQNQIVTVLILEGLPMSPEFVSILARGLSKNKTLQHLNLQHCAIGDEGCDILAKTLRYVSNVATLDLSHCNITAIGVKYLSELIKYQKITRYSESWKQTLRYREPDLDGMRGLRRLTLNSNTAIGDDGLIILVEVLQDDLWMKAVDLQNCGITDVGADKINNLLAFNGVIDIVDIRRNPDVSHATMQNVMMMLCKNCPMDNADKQFQWLNTTTTLNSCSIANSISQAGLNGSGTSHQLHLNLSDHASKRSTAKSQVENGLKRSNTTFALARRASDTVTGVSKPRDVWSPVKIPSIVDCKPSVAEQLKIARSKIKELQLQLEDEVAERQKVDSLNVQLHSQLMEVMGRAGGLGDGGIRYKDDCVYVKKDVLEDIYQAFNDVYTQFSAHKVNGINKHKNPVFQKLQKIIEESPPTSHEGSSNETRYSQSPKKVNHTGDMPSPLPFLTPDINGVKDSAPRAQCLFNALLSQDEDQSSGDENDEYHYENDEYVITDESARSEPPLSLRKK